VKSDLAIKVFAEDLDAMTAAGDAIRRALMQVPGASDVKMEILSGLPSILVKTDRERGARLGIPSRAPLDAVEMTRAGHTVGRVREGERVFELVLRLGGDLVVGPDDLARRPIATRQGKLVLLALVADVSEERTLLQIGREQMRRRLIVQANVGGRDMVGFVRDAQGRVDKLVLPKSVELEWGGQFQNFNRAKNRLGSLVPVALGVIALMLLMTFRNVPYALVAVLNLPFAVARGAAALVAGGLPFSIPAGVAFIALCGVSVMNGVVMVTRLGDEPDTLPAELRVPSRRWSSGASCRRWSSRCPPCRRCCCSRSTAGATLPPVRLERPLHERVRDLPAVEQVADARGRDQRGLQLFHRVELGCPHGARFARDEGVAVVALQGRVGLDDEQRLQAFGPVPRLLAELARRGVLRGLPRVDDAARDLEGEGVAAEAVLPDEDDLVLGRDRDHVAPVVAAQREGVPPVAASGVLELDAPDLEHAERPGALLVRAPPLAEARGRDDGGGRFEGHVMVAEIVPERR
jgi:hypothetical protein